MEFKFVTYAPYAWRAFQARAKLGLLQEDGEALWNAAQPLLKELKSRWPQMNNLVRTLIAEIAPEFATQALAGTTKFDPTDLFQVQEKLKLMGYYEGKIDGLNGDKMTAAVFKLQDRLGITGKKRDGLWGPETAGGMLALPEFK